MAAYTSARALHVGMPIGAIYKIWATSGVAVTAVRATLLSSDSLTPATGGGVHLDSLLHDDKQRHATRNALMASVGPLEA